MSSLLINIHSSETDFQEAKNDDYTHVVLYKMLQDRFLTTNMLNVTDGTFKKFSIKSKTYISTSLFLKYEPYNFKIVIKPKNIIVIMYLIILFLI